MFRNSTSHRSQINQACLQALESRQLLSMSPATTYAAGDAPQDVITADFNEDGRLDLATANYYGNTITTRLGNGDGTFQSPQTSAAGWMPSHLAAGDFNRDGRQDLATAGGSGADVLLGNGDGTFSAPASTGVGYAESVTVGDLNFDGVQDLVVTGSSISVLLGTGNGTFLKPTAAWTEDVLVAATIADFNGDGNQDVAATDVDDAQVRMYLGDGQGNLYLHGSTASGPSPVSVTAGDVNGDGKMDVVTANRGGASVTVLLGNGSGGLAQRQDYAAGFQPTDVALADFDRDGDLDIAVADYNRVNVHKGSGSGNGSFSSFAPANSYAAGMGTWAVATGDFNADGWADIATANQYDDSMSVLLNDKVWTSASPSLSVGDVSVTEGNSGVTYATFTVSMSAASDQPVTVNYGTQNGTAVAGSDYQAASGTLTFAAGETTKTVRVAIFGETLIENDEHFSLVLSGASYNSSIMDSTGVGSILNDERKGGRKG